MGSSVRVPLDVLRVEEPCTRDWNTMAGDDRTRCCAGCGLHVHNLSAMTRGEAERLVCERAGRLCVRFERAASGRVLTLDYAKPAGGRKWRFWAMLGAAGATIAAVLNVFAARSRVNSGPVMGMMRPTQGAIAFPIAPPAPLGPPHPAELGTACGVPGAVQPAPTPPASVDTSGPLGPPAPDTDHDAFTAEPW